MKKLKSLFFLILSTFAIIGTNFSANDFSVPNKAIALESKAKDEGFEIEVMDLGFEKGDCSLINMDGHYIMIDAGGNTDSGPIIYEKIKDIKTIDYMILTHADSDHIVNFGNEKGMGKWFREGGKIKTLIDFDMKEKGKYFTTLTYINYCTARDIKFKKNIENHYTAYECVNSLNGAKPYYQISGRNDGLRILDNYFYDKDAPGAQKACQSNMLSVCCLITYHGKKALFTGDIEEFDSGQSNSDNRDEYGNKGYTRTYGETFLAAANYKYLKDGVDFYKAAHHGSYSSNSSNLLDIIRPRFIAISGGASSTSQLKWPGALALNNMAKWTDRIYMTCKYEDDDNPNSDIIPYFGDVICKFDSRINDLTFTSSEIKSRRQDECGFMNDWFLNNRAAPINIYNLGEIDKYGNGVIFSFTNRVKINHKKSVEDNVKMLEKIYEKQAKVHGNYDKTNCTYIKFGHIDILVNYGGELTSTNFMYNALNKIDKLCNDHILEYLIVSDYSYDSIRGLIGNKGLLHKSKINQIDNLYHFGTENLNLNKSLKKDVSSILKAKQLKKANIKTSSQLNDKCIEIFKDNKYDFELNLNFLNMPLTNKSNISDVENVRDYSLKFNFEVNYGRYKYKYSNIGYFKTATELKELYEENKSKLSSINDFELMNHFYFDGQEKGIDQILKRYLNTIGDPNILVNGAYQASFDKITHSNQQLQQQLELGFKLSTIYSNTIYTETSSRCSNEISYGNINSRILFGDIFRSATYASKSANYYSRWSSQSFVKI